MKGALFSHSTVNSKDFQAVFCSYNDYFITKFPKNFAKKVYSIQGELIGTVDFKMNGYYYGRLLNIQFGPTDSLFRRTYNPTHKGFSSLSKDDPMIGRMEFQCNVLLSTKSDTDLNRLLWIVDDSPNIESFNSGKIVIRFISNKIDCLASTQSRRTLEFFTGPLSDEDKASYIKSIIESKIYPGMYINGYIGESYVVILVEDILDNGRFLCEYFTFEKILYSSPAFITKSRLSVEKKGRGSLSCVEGNFFIESGLIEEWI